MRKAIVFVLSAVMVFCGIVPSYAYSVSDGGFETNLLTPEKIFEVGNPLYTVGEDGINNLKAGDTITMTLTGKWLGEKKSGMIAVCVLYDENGTAKAMSYGEPEDIGENGFRYVVSLKISEAYDKGKYRLGTYLWQGLDCKRVFTEGYGYCSGANTKVRNTKWEGIEGIISLSSEEKYSGLSSLKIESSEKTSKNAAVLEAAVPAAGVWRLSFAAKGNSAFGYDVTSSDGSSLIAGGDRTFECSDDWNFPCDAVFDTGNDETVKIVLSDKDVSGISWIDDIAFEKTLYKNEGFNLSALSKTEEFAVAPNRVYTLKFSASGDECKAYIRINGKIIAHISVPASGSPAENSMDFYADDDCLNAEYEICSNGNTQITNLTVSQASSDIIVNGDFENGSEQPWYIRNKVYGNTLSLIEGKTGEYGIKLTKRRDVFNGIEQNISDGLNRFGTGKYKVSGYVRFDGADAPGEVAVKIMTQKTPQKLYVLNPISNVQNDWVYFEEIIDIDRYGTDDNAQEFSDTAVIFVNTNVGVYNLCIDGFKMEALGRNPKPPVYTEIDE